MTERFPHTETVWALQLTLSEASEQLQSLHKKKKKQAWEPEINGRNREVCEEQQKCRRRRGSAERESTRERIQRAEVTSWKPSVTKLEEMFWGRSRLLELKSCFIFSSDVRWCQMMWDDWQTEWLTPQMDVKPSRLINRWTTVLESVWISK